MTRGTYEPLSQNKSFGDKFLCKEQEEMSRFGIIHAHHHENCVDGHFEHRVPLILSMSSSRRDGMS